MTLEMQKQYVSPNTPFVTTPPLFGFWLSVSLLLLLRSSTECKSDIVFLFRWASISCYIILMFIVSGSSCRWSFSSMSVFSNSEKLCWCTPNKPFFLLNVVVLLLFLVIKIFLLRHICMIFYLFCLMRWRRIFGKLKRES